MHTGHGTSFICCMPLADRDLPGHRKAAEPSDKVKLSRLQRALRPMFGSVLVCVLEGREK